MQLAAVPCESEGEHRGVPHGQGRCGQSGRGRLPDVHHSVGVARGHQDAVGGEAERRIMAVGAAAPQDGQPAPAVRVPQGEAAPDVGGGEVPAVGTEGALGEIVLALHSPDPLEPLARRDADEHALRGQRGAAGRVRGDGVPPADRRGPPRPHRPAPAVERGGPSRPVPPGAAGQSLERGGVHRTGPALFPVAQDARVEVKTQVAHRRRVDGKGEQRLARAVVRGVGQARAPQGEGTQGPGQGVVTGELHAVSATGQGQPGPFPSGAEVPGDDTSGGDARHGPAVGGEGELVAPAHDPCGRGGHRGGDGARLAGTSGEH